MNIIQRIQDGNTSRRIERAVQCENRLKELSSIAVHRRVVYDGTRSKYLTGISTIDTQEQMDKGGENAQYLSFLRGRILDKLSAVEKDYRNETLKNTKEALEIKGQLIKLYSYEGIEKSTKDTLNQDRIGAAYETVLEAFKQKKIDKEKLKEVRKQVESKLNKQVAYSDMIVMDALGRVLLLKRSEGDGQFDGKWGLPGGHVDPDETHLEAGVRELAEESIISVTPETCSKVAELNNDKAHIEYFRTYVDYIPIVGINAREHSDYEWVDPVNLTKYDLIGDLEKTLKEVFKYVLDPKVVEVKKAFNTILTAYFIGKVDEDTISKVSEIYLEKAEKNKGEKKVGKVMREYKEGTLHSGSGEKVTSREQAIAIALSEARKIQKSDETQTEEVNVEKGKKVKDLAKKYHEWNTQGGEPAYKKPSEASVLEFLQNNYEDLSEDDETKKGLLNELNTTSLSKAISTIIDGLKGNVIEYDLVKAKVRKYIKKEADGKGGFIYVYKQDKLQSDNLNIKLIQEYGEKIIKGEISIKRLLPEEERGRIKGGRRNVEATIVLGTGKKTNQGVYARSDSEKREDVERMGKGKVQIRKALEVLELAYQQGQIPLDVLEKARHGVYADNAQNRELHRVGQPYGKKGEEDEKSGKEGKAKVVNADDKKQQDQPQSLPDQAKQVSGSALEQAAKEAKDPEVRIAAHQELKRRESEEKGQEDKGEKKEDNEERDNGYEEKEVLKLSEKQDKQIRDLLTKYDIEYNGNISTSITDYGISHYFTVKNGETGKNIKVRISDHEATNTYRQENEYMLNGIKEENFKRLEFLVHPERFELKEVTDRKPKVGDVKRGDKFYEKVKKQDKVEKSVKNDTWEQWL